MSKKREAEREAWKERRQALNNIQQQNDELYAQRIVDLDKHPLLQGITNTREYKKIHRQLKNAALTQDIWADGFTLENKPVVQNSAIQQDQPVVQQQSIKQDVVPMEFSGPISIKIGDSKITVNSKEEADKLLEELAKNTPIYGKDRYEASLNDLRSILYTGKGNTKMHSGLMANLSGLSRLQMPTSSVSSSTVKSDSDVTKSETDKTPTLWNAIIQSAYGGKYDPNIVLSGVDTRDYNTRFEIYKNAIKLIDPTIITEGKTEDQINNELFKKGLFDVNAAAWLQRSPDYDTKGVVEKEDDDEHPYKKTYDEDALYNGFTPVEGYKNFLDDNILILKETNDDGSIKDIYVVQNTINPQTGKYDTQYSYTDPIYDNGYFLYKDDDGKYHFGKVGEQGFTEQDNQYLSDFIDNTYRAPYRINQYDPKTNNYILDQIIPSTNTNKYFQDITPNIKNIPQGTRVVVTNPETIGLGGTFNDTPIFFINGYEIVRGLATSTESGDISVQFLNEDGSLNGKPKEFKKNNNPAVDEYNILNEYKIKYPYKGRQLRHDLNEDPEMPTSQLYDNGRFEKGAKAQSAKSNNILDYQEPDKIANIIDSVLYDIPDEDTDDEDYVKYMYFALRAIEQYGGEYALRKLGVDEQTIANFYYKIFKFIYGDQIVSEKQGGVLMAQKGINTSNFKKLEITEDEPKYTYKPVQKVDDGRKETDDMTAVDWTVLGLDAASMVAAYVPVYGTAASVVLGLISTAVQGVDDLTDGEKDGQFWKNLGINLGFTVLGAIPGLNSGKLAKGGKQAAKVFDDVIKGCDTALQGVKAGSKEAKEINKIRKAAEASLEQLKPDKIKENLGLLGRLGEQVASNKTASTVVNWTDNLLKGAAVIGGGASAYNIVNDAYKGKDFDWNNAMGLLSLGMAGAGRMKNKAFNKFSSHITTKDVASPNVSKLKVKVGRGDDLVEVEIPVSSNMSDSDIQFKAKEKLEQDLSVKQARKQELENNQNKTAEENSELNLLNRQIDKISRIFSQRTRAEKFSHTGKIKVDYDKNQLNSAKNNSADEIQMLDKDVEVGLGRIQKQYLKLAEKFGFKREDSEEGKQIIEMLEFLKNPNKFKRTTGKNKSSQVRTPRQHGQQSGQQQQVQQPVQPQQDPQIVREQDGQLAFFKKGGQLYNSKEVDSLVNLKKKDVTKYQSPAGPITMGNQYNTNFSNDINPYSKFYDVYNKDLLTLFTNLSKEGKLTQDLVNQYNTLFNDKQSLNTQAYNQGYDGSSAFVDKSGKTKAYQDQFHNLGGHTSNFMIGWNQNYAGNQFSSAEKWGENGVFTSDNSFGEKTHVRNMNLFTDAEAQAINNAIKNSGFQLTLMDNATSSGADGRQYYHFTPLSTQPTKETELTTDKPTDISLTPEKPEYSRPTGFSWSPLKAGVDVFLDYQANKDILESSYQDAPPGRSYVDGYKKVTDNFASRQMAAKNAGQLNTQAAFLANNTADIDKANAVQLQGYNQGLNANYDATMKSYDEYKRTSAEQEDLRRKYDLQNNEIKYQNDMQQYQNKLINKNRFVQFLNANKASRQTARNWLDSRLIEETKAYTDLYNRDLMADAEMNKSNALTMAMNDYYTNVGLANDVDKEFADYLKTWKDDENNFGKTEPTMDSTIGETGETYNEKKARLQKEAQIKYQNAIQIADADYQAASNYTMPYINQYYNWIPNFYRRYMYPGIDKKAQGGTLNFKEKKELLRLKSGYQQLRETVKDIQKSIDNGEKQLDRISSGLSKERLLLLKNMLK